MNKVRLYRWQALDTQGKIRDGEMIATAKDAVFQHLFQEGLQPLSVRFNQRLAASYWRTDDLIVLFRQLATLLQAGLPLVNALTLLASEHHRPGWRCLMREVTQQIAQGRPFSTVIAEHPTVFPNIYRQVIEIGELTGKLDDCCQQLALLQERQQQLHKTVKKAIRYPMIVCVIALLVSLLMLTLVLPEFARIYDSFDAPLPWFTLTLMAFSDWLIAKGPWCVAAIIIAVVIYMKRCHPQPHWQFREQTLLLAVPLISRLICGGCLTQIFQTLAMTQQAGLNLITGLQAAALSINNRCFQQAINEIQHQVTQGIPLHQALAKQRLFPPLCQQLIRIGEESGALDTLLARLAHWNEQQTYQLAEGLAQTLEPIMMLIVGGLVGGLVIAMYLPIFQLGSVMG